MELFDKFQKNQTYDQIYNFYFDSKLTLHQQCKSFLDKKNDNALSDISIEELVCFKRNISNIIKISTDFLKYKNINKAHDLIIIKWLLTHKLFESINNHRIIPCNSDKNYTIDKEFGHMLSIEEMNNFNNLLYQMCLCFRHNYPNYDLNPNYKLSVKASSRYIYYNYSFLKYILDSHKYEHIKYIYIGDPNLFDEKVFKLCLQYEFINLDKYHNAIPKKVFNTLIKYLNIRTELFASPFNNTLKDYYSPYPNDKYFGSKGDFFVEYKNIFKNGGSFQAFPPMIEEYITLFIMILYKELINNKNPLSVALVIPYWLDVKSIKVLFSSYFLINSIIYEENTHYFTCYESTINDNREPHKDRLSKSKSCIMILQNDSGREKYKYNNSLFEELSDNFKMNNK